MFLCRIKVEYLQREHAQERQYECGAAMLHEATDKVGHRKPQSANTIRALAFFLLWLVLSAFIGACRDTQTVSGSPTSAPLPAELAKILSVPNSGDTFSIRVYVTAPAHSEPFVANNLTLADGGNTVRNFSVDLPVGDIQLYLDYVLTTTPWGNVVVARSNTLSANISAGNANIDFSSATLTLPDSDDDSTDNLTEIRNGTNPFEKNSPPNPVDPAPAQNTPSIAAPTNVRVITGDGQLSLRWDAVVDAASYNVYFGTSNRIAVANYRSDKIPAINTNAANINLPGLGTGTTYYLLITAINGQTESAPTAAIGTPSTTQQTQFHVSVKISGLKGTLVLNDGIDDLTATSNGNYSFATPLENNSQYRITVKTQPANQSCRVSDSTLRTIRNASVFGIDVSCDLPKFWLKATVSGLGAMQGLVLQVNGGQDIPVNDNTTFNVAQLADGARYFVMVKTDPPGEHCSVINSRGVVTSQDVSDIQVNCYADVAPHYALSGSITGLKGTLTLLNKRGSTSLDEIIIARNGAFAFKVPLASNDDFDIAITRQPTAQQCILTNGKGKIAGTNIDNLLVSCADSLLLDATPLNEAAIVSWPNYDAPNATLYVSTNRNCDWNNYRLCAGGQMLPNVSSPVTVTDLTNDTTHYLRLVTQYPNAPEMVESLASARPGKLRPNGSVGAIEVDSDGTVYIGGEFTEIGVPTGGGIVLDVDSGKLLSTFRIEGSVSRVISDGASGWYVAGSFTTINGKPQQNLAHILDDDQLDDNFNFPVDGKINTLVLRNDTLYVGGAFSKIGTEERANLASININTRELNRWRPDPDKEITAAASFQDQLYVTGAFSIINKEPRFCIVSFDSAGELTNWFTNLARPECSVTTLAANSKRLFVSGSFANVNGTPRNTIAAFNTDGRLDSAWKITLPANTSLVPNVLTLNNDVLYFAGTQEPQFNQVLRGVDAETGVAVFDYPIYGRSDRTISIAATQKSLFRASWNSNAADSAATAASLVDKRIIWAKHHPTPNYKQLNDMQDIEFVAINGSRVFVAGKFISLAGNNASRPHFAALDVAGHLLPLRINFDGPIDKILHSGQFLYFAGPFLSVNAQRRLYLAATDLSGNVLLDWNPINPDSALVGGLTDMTHLNDTLFVTGSIYSYNVGGVNRKGLFAVASNGQITTWSPTTNTLVNTLANDGAKIFTGGDFTNIDNHNLSYLAAIDTNAELLFDWGPRPNGSVMAVAIDGSTVFAGGNFSTMNAGNSPRPYLAAFKTTGDLLPKITASPNNYVSQLAIDPGNFLFLLGAFSALDSEPRAGIGAIRIADGRVVTSWSPRPDVTPLTIATNPINHKVYIGGRFRYVDNRLQPYFAELAPP